jgi:hypothetical protein
MNRNQKLVEIFKDSEFRTFEEEAKTNDMIDTKMIPSEFIEGQIVSSTGQGQIYMFRLNDKFYSLDLGWSNDAGYSVTSYEDLSEEEWTEFIEDFLDEEGAYWYEGELVDQKVLDRIH